MPAIADKVKQILEEDSRSRIAGLSLICSRTLGTTEHVVAIPENVERLGRTQGCGHVVSKVACGFNGSPRAGG